MNPVSELEALLGPTVVTTAPDDLIAHAHDHSPGALIDLREGAGRAAMCVVKPRSTEDVATLLRWADERRTPVVPFGLGSGVCGGVVASDAVSVDMTAMDAVMDIDHKSRLVRAQAGISGPALRDALAAEELTLGHEPQSLAISTLGGWVATRAIGQLSSRFGGIEDMVTGLEAVLAGGRVVRSRVAPRSSTGPDVAALMIGSEGTLGVVTEATLRVEPITGPRLDLCVTFDHMAEGVAACRTLAQARLEPLVARLYDADDTLLFLRSYAEELSGPVLVMSFEGVDARARLGRARELVGGSPAPEGVVAHWWEHRNDAVGEYRRVMTEDRALGPHAVVDTMEVAGNWSALRDLYHGVRESLQPHADFVGCHISHIYPDGACLYFTIAAATEADDAARRKLATWWQEGMTACLAAGGSISHHHGIGRVKGPWLKEQLGGWWDVLVAVKRAVDPNGIMNPGALGL